MSGFLDSVGPPRGLGRGLAAGGLLAVAVFSAGCSPTVRVEAPKEPIRIELDVKIEQEVRVRIDRELEDAFDQNDEIF
ncbi:MAG: YnbE family lipoprotein [Azospirillaceae bacterium]